MKYALIGCGRIATNHIKAVLNNKLELVAAENQDPASERHSFGEGFIIGMTYSKK